MKVIAQQSRSFNATLQDFRNMFASDKQGDFKYTVSHTHGQLYVRDGSLKSANTYCGRGSVRSDVTNLTLKHALVKAFMVAGATPSFVNSVYEKLGITATTEAGETDVSDLRRADVRELLECFEAERESRSLGRPLGDRTITQKNGQSTVAKSGGVGVKLTRKESEGQAQNSALLNDFIMGFDDVRTNGEKLFALINREGAKCDTKKLGSPDRNYSLAAQFGDSKKEREEIFGAIKSTLCYCKSDSQRRAFLSLTLSFTGARDLRNNFRSGHVEAYLDQCLTIAKTVADACSPENLDAWCAFLAADNQRSTLLTEDFVQTVDASVRRFGDWLSGVSGKQHLTAKDVENLCLILPLSESNAERKVLMRNTIGFLANKMGLLKPKMLNTFLSPKNLDLTINEMLDKFKEAVPDNMNQFISALGFGNGDEVNFRYDMWAVDKAAKDPETREGCKKAVKSARAHVEQMNALAMLVEHAAHNHLDDGIEQDRAAGLTNAIPGKMPIYCQERFKREFAKQIKTGKPVANTFYHVVELFFKGDQFLKMDPKEVSKMNNVAEYQKYVDDQKEIKA